MKKISPRIGILILPLLSACATHTFTVTSDPLQADVYYQVAGTDERKPLGKTPLTMPMTEFKKVIGDVPPGQYLPITIEKPGFDSETIAVPASRFGTLLTDLNIKLKAGAKRDHEQQTAKMIIDQLFLAQKYALTQQFERAQAELDRILESFPTFARAMSMRASIYYAQKNFPESLRWYEQALKADPQMEDAVKISAKIRALGGDRSPAANGPAAITGSGAPAVSAPVEVPATAKPAAADAPTDTKGGK